MPDHLKPSRMLLRLDAEIVAATTHLEADCKRAERAVYLSRLGRFEEARSDLDGLHARYDRSPNPLLSSWLNLGEGLFIHFSDMGTSARDRVLRSYALSTAANLTRIRGLSAAWLAHMDYLQVNVVSMARHVSESLQLAGPEEHATRSRACLVVAQALHLAGTLERALPWYRRSRDHALADGDEATVSALLHNMAWLRAQQMRANAWRVEDKSHDEVYALLSTDSTANFDLLIGSTSLPTLVPILRAQVLAASRRYAEALALFESTLEGAVREGMGRLRADLLADKAWCRARLGQLEAARDDALAAEASIDVNGQFDDRAMAHGRLAQVFDLVGDPERAKRHELLATQAWTGHAELQAHILDSMRAFKDG